MFCSRKILSLLLLLAGFSSAYAAHLVGGELSYECIGNNNYAIRMVIYRDCASLGVQFDQPATITIYDGNNNLISNRKVYYNFSGNLPVVAPNNCTQLPNFVCTERAIYRDTVNLQPNASGYIITHQRCCRNATISNIPNPSAWGSTYTIEIPPNDNSCNSSAEFKNPPPVALCLNVPVELDLSATEPDGDSLVYSLCGILHGGGPSTSTAPNAPAPDPALPPPYAPVPFSNNFSAVNPIRSSPQFTINPQTGQITGRPNQVGQYVFAICVSEYRNGQLLSTTRRDFQFNVTGFCTGVAAVIDGQNVDPSSLCTGKTINFKESCVNASGYFWDFGDPTTNADTSNLKNPSYTYSDTGTYTVMLVGNPNSNCADTTFSVYRVYDSVSVSFSYSSDVCFDVHQIDFNVSGVYGPNTSFSWNFGGGTNQGFTSRQQAPQGIRYNQPGTYPVRVTVEEYQCSNTFYDTIELYERPVLRHIVPQVQACAPAAVSFRDSSDYTGTVSHFWSFGDGGSSNNASVVHVYTEPGTYTVTHSLVSRTGCKDTLTETFPQHITIFPSPTADFTLSPKQTTIYKPEIVVTDNSQDAQYTVTIMPNGDRFNDISTQIYTAKDTGTLQFQHIAINEYGCADSITQYVYIEEPVNFFIPNAFTPNGDGLNDEFSYVVTGAKNHVFEVFNRWGEIVFKATDDSDSWNGQNFNTGEQTPGGIYTYVLKAYVESIGKDKVFRGTITIMR